MNQKKPHANVRKKKEGNDQNGRRTGDRVRANERVSNE